jgi:hypothetical protein
MKTRFLTLVALCVLFFLPFKTVFAENTPIKLAIPTVTLLVKKYSDLEKTLQNSILQGDKKTIDHLLDASFEERKADNPNSPIPREEWITFKMKQKNSGTISQMAVREFGDIFIVSYLFTQDNHSMLIVDVWKKINDTSVLMVRYSSSFIGSYKKSS